MIKKRREAACMHRTRNHSKNKFSYYFEFEKLKLKQEKSR